MTQEIEQPEKVIRTVRLETRFTPEARERIVKFMQSFVSFKPVLGLLYGDVPADGAAKGTWSIAALGQQTVDDLIDMYAGEADQIGALAAYGFSQPVGAVSQLLCGSPDPLNHFIGNRELVELVVQYPRDGSFAHVAVSGDIVEGYPVAAAFSFFLRRSHNAY